VEAARFLQSARGARPLRRTPRHSLAAFGLLRSTTPSHITSTLPGRMGSSGSKNTGAAAPPSVPILRVPALPAQPAQYRFADNTSNGNDDVGSPRRRRLRMRGFLVGLVVLAACSDPVTDSIVPVTDTGTLSGTWQIEQPSAWTDFRFTLTQAACTRVLVNDPCNFAITGNGAITPAVCSFPPLGALGYPCSGVFPVSGKRVADSVTVNLGAYSDGASLDFAGRVAVDRSVIGDLAFRDASGVSHHIGGGCGVGAVCLDTPGQLHFIRGGTTVVASGVSGRP
jgi:hypothetical protein